MVAGAATQVALQPEAHLAFGGGGVLVEKADRGHDHARRAVATLEAVALAERLLHRVEHIAVGEAFDGGDLLPIGLDGEHGARLHRFAVHVQRAGAARGRVTADIRAGQAEVFPHVVH